MLGVRPDLATWAKAIGGGAPIGGFGGRAGEEINRGAAHQGTSTATPCRSPPRRHLTRVPTADAYEHF